MTPVEPSPAASVILVRPGGAEPVEVYLIRRHPRMRFLGGYHAFPGGRVEPGDAAPDMLARCRGLDPVRAEAVLPGGDLPSLGFWVAAARELLEETGVCLVRDRLDLPIETARSDVREAVERCRLGLVARETTFAALLAREGWRCDLGSLRYFSHFTTPVASPIRFSARFFLCPLPAGQTPRLASSEATDGFWIGAAAGLRRYQSGQLPMAEPPEYALVYLAQFDSVEEVWAAHADGQHKVHGILDRNDAFYSEGFDRAGRPHRSRGRTA